MKRTLYKFFGYRPEKNKKTFSISLRYIVSMNRGNNLWYYMFLEHNKMRHS